VGKHFVCVVKKGQNLFMRGTTIVPNELVIEILQFLPLNCLVHDVALVNQQFHSNVWHHTRKITLKKTGIKDKRFHLLTNLVPEIICKFTGLEELYLDDLRKDVPAMLLTELSTHCPRLTSLSLQNCNQLTTFCIDDSITLRLQHLDLTCCARLRNITIKGDRIVKTLTSLNLSHTAISDAEITVFTNHLTKLKELILKGCSNIKHPAINSSSLSFLNLRQCTELREAKALVCPQLSILNLSSCHINDDDLSALLDQIGNQLQYLELRRCTNLFTRTFNAPVFAMQLQNIRTLHINHTHVTDTYVNDFALHCKHLEIFELSWCPKIEQPRIIHDNLEFLYIDFSANINDDTVLMCPKLRKLNIARTNLTASWLVNTLNTCYASIQQVNIEGCPEMQDMLKLEQEIKEKMTDKVATIDQLGGNRARFLNAKGRRAKLEPAFEFCFINKQIM
jgi:hypothetical protein